MPIQNQSLRARVILYGTYLPTEKRLVSQRWEYYILIKLIARKLILIQSLKLLPEPRHSKHCRLHFYDSTADLVTPAVSCHFVLKRFYHSRLGEYVITSMSQRNVKLTMG